MEEVHAEARQLRDQGELEEAAATLRSHLARTPGDVDARLPERYPAVRALLFFAVASDATVTYQPLDWTFLDSPAVIRAVAEEIARWGEPPSRATPGELPSGPGAPLIRAPTAPEARPPAG